MQFDNPIKALVSLKIIISYIEMTQTLGKKAKNEGENLSYNKN